MWLKVKRKKLKDFYSFGKNGNVKEQNKILFLISSRASFLTWPGSPVCHRFQASPLGSRLSSASAERKGGAPTSSLSKSGRRWRRPQTPRRRPRPWTPSVGWSPAANGCAPRNCPASWSPSWCVSAPGTSTERRDEATLSTQWPTSTCKTAPPCGDWTGWPTPAPGVSPTPVAWWWTIVTSWTTRPRTALCTCRIRSWWRRSRFWGWCLSSRRRANCK